MWVGKFVLYDEMMRWWGDEMGGSLFVVFWWWDVVVDGVWVLMRMLMCCSGWCLWIDVGYDSGDVGWEKGSDEDRGCGG